MANCYKKPSKNSVLIKCLQCGHYFWRRSSFKKGFRPYVCPRQTEVGSFHVTYPTTEQEQQEYEGRVR